LALASSLRLQASQVNTFLLALAKQSINKTIKLVKIALKKDVQYLTGVDLFGTTAATSQGSRSLFFGRPEEAAITHLTVAAFAPNPDTHSTQSHGINPIPIAVHLVLLKQRQIIFLVEDIKHQKSQVPHESTAGFCLLQ